MKAVEATERRESGEKGYLARLVQYRDREWDGRDYTAALLVIISSALIVVFSFLPWFRLSFFAGEGSNLQVVEIEGSAISFLVYLLIGLAAVSFVYMVLSWILRKPLAVVDFGVVSMIAGIVFMIVFIIIMSSDQRLLGAAAKKLDVEEAYFRSSFVRYDKQILWPAYTTVIMGLLMAMAGWIRLSERRRDLSGE